MPRCEPHGWRSIQRCPRGSAWTILMSRWSLTPPQQTYTAWATCALTCTSSPCLSVARPVALSCACIRGHVPEEHRIVLRGLPVTRAGWMIGDLLADHVDPESVARITAEVVDRVLDYPSVVAERIAPSRRGSGYPPAMASPCSTSC